MPPLVPHQLSIVLWSLCNWVLISFCTCPHIPFVSLPRDPLSPAPVLLMACQPCRGAGRIWCCRSHKVRPWGLGRAWVPASTPSALGGQCRTPLAHACIWHVADMTRTETVIPGTRLDLRPGPLSCLLPAVFPLPSPPPPCCSSHGCLGLLPLSLCLSQCVCLSVLCPANGCPVRIPETPSALKSPDMGSRSLVTLGRGNFWEVDPLDLGRREASSASWRVLGIPQGQASLLIHGFISLALR